MIRTVLIGLLLFLAFAVALAPASLMRAAMPAGHGVELLDTRGTLWDGSGALYLAGQSAGRLGWDFQPVSLVRGTVAYHVTLRGTEQHLSGAVDLGTSGSEATLNGQASAAFANRWLQSYEIALTGDLEFHDAHIKVPYDYPQAGGGAGSGDLTWTGGPVSYRLGGRSFSGALPPLAAYIGDGLEAVVYPQGGQTPLLHLAMQPNGFIRIGVTQLLTELAGNPWPGSHDDHDVVLEVEEQLF